MMNRMKVEKFDMDFVWVRNIYLGLGVVVLLLKKNSINFLSSRKHKKGT